MNEIDNEKAILEEAPDFDNQLKILEEERKEVVKKRKWYILIMCIFLLIALIIFISYSSIYFYHEFGHRHHFHNCENVNLKVNGSLVPNLNLTDGKDCKPVYNIDYFNNLNATFNIDIFGDKSLIFNATNQLDASSTYCILNCDSNNDGWPDYNLDLNGDGIADINIIKDHTKNICELNCDLNYDTIPDVNIDVDGDGIADINILDQNGIPKYNIDYKNNRKPIFNVLDGEKILNPVIYIGDNPKCDTNCDIDGDGFPDYNITLTEGGTKLNELVSTGNSSISFNNTKEYDWKCKAGIKTKDCDNDTTTTKNKYINIDIDGNGMADVNILSEKGSTLINEINKNVKGYKFNIDENGDGFPDYNIDLDNDGIADLNIIDHKTNKCIKNCDTNNDGIADYLISISKDYKVSIYNLNIDVDYDGICDINCDLNYDLYPDINIDINGDNIADQNIDFNHDKEADFNLDSDNDNIVDMNLDAYGTGVCNFNCNGQNKVDISANCTKNCDTNSDGWPDKNVDINGDGICDFNCNNGSENIDKDNNYYLDSEYNATGILDISEDENANFYILNPLDIKSDNIEPGWDEKYVLKIVNNTNYAVSYKIVWENVTNEFTDINNLDYDLFRSNTTYLNNLKAPRRSVVLKDNIIIRAQSSASFVMDISFKETGINQNIDSGKTFKGKLKIQVID